MRHALVGFLESHFISGHQQRRLQTLIAVSLRKSQNGPLGRLAAARLTSTRAAFAGADNVRKITMLFENAPSISLQSLLSSDSIHAFPYMHYPQRARRRTLNTYRLALDQEVTRLFALLYQRGHPKRHTAATSPGLRLLVRVAVLRLYLSPLQLPAAYR